jgi:hypothetical protein
MVHHFNHRFGTYEGQTESQANQNKLPELDDEALADPDTIVLPRYWVAEREVDAALRGKWDRDWLLGWRDIARNTDARTVITSAIPRVGVGDKFLLALPTRGEATSLLAMMASPPFDYIARQKLGGTSLKYFVMRQLSVLQPHRFTDYAPWDDASLDEWVRARAVELVYTSWDIAPFAVDHGYDGPPFPWDPERRFLLRCELDAAFFHLYGLERDDVDYVMDTFPIVRRRDEQAHGEYRTKRLILEIYDELAEAIATGRPYQTRLDPPPADPRVAHPPRAAEPVP